MSYLGIVVASLFASNALLTYGLGSLPDQKRGDTGSFASALALACVNALASAFLWSLHTLVLAPLGLASLDILFFMLLAVPLLRFIARAASSSGKGLLSLVGSRCDDLVVGSLVFGVAFLSARSGYALSEALAASAASGLGYWLAEFLLESLRERLDLSDLPYPFRGAPAMLISAGLMALAFMGMDAAFIKSLAG
jgi:Na+-translocating ferredoxin:NAD+ oxidoreductase subunit A